MTKQSCNVVDLVSSKTSQIKYCEECQEVHLIMGPISLTLSVDHFKQLASDLGNGVAELELSSTSSEDPFQMLDPKVFHS